jgi:hypothetical protein
VVGEDVLENRDADEAPDDPRVHGLGHALGAALGGDALVDADGRHDGAEEHALDLPAHHVHDRALAPEAGHVAAGVDTEQEVAGEEAGDHHERDHRQVVERSHQHQRQRAGHDDEQDVGHSHHAERVQFRTHLAGAEVRHDGGAADTGHHEPGGHRAQLPDVRHDLEAAQPVEAGEGLEELAGLDGDEEPETRAGQKNWDEISKKDCPALLQELLPVEGTPERPD